MKKFWKRALSLLTLATVVPVSIKHDEATGKTTYQSLLASLEVGPSRDGTHTNVGLNLGEGALSGPLYQHLVVRKEAAMYADDEPETAVPFLPSGEPTEETPADVEDPVSTEE